MIEGMIQIPIQKVNDLIHEVYRNSVPVGYGHLHYKAGDLPDSHRIALHKKFMESFTEAGIKPWRDEQTRNVMVLDYVEGRCCKMYSHRDEKGNIYIRDKWPDHDWLQLQAIVDVLGLNVGFHGCVGRRMVGCGNRVWR